MNGDFRSVPIEELLADGQTVIEPDELWCVDYLQTHRVLPGLGSFGVCGFMNNEIPCGANFIQYNKHERSASGEVRVTAFMRCTRKHCQTYRSLRACSWFLNMYDRDEKCRNGLSLAKVMVLVWCWVSNVSGRSACTVSKRSHRTVLDWYGRCQGVTVRYYQEHRGMLGGRAAVVRLGVTSFVPDGDGNGPWIFGIYGAVRSDDDDDGGDDDQAEWRFFKVKSLNIKRILAIVEQEVAPGTTLRPSSRLGYLGGGPGPLYYVLENAAADARKTDQILKSSWRQIKSRYRIHSNRMDDDAVNGKLKQHWWRSKFNDKNPSNVFDTFWNHVSLVSRFDLSDAPPLTPGQQQRRRRQQRLADDSSP